MITRDLQSAASDLVAPPRLEVAPVALECRYNREVELRPATTLLLLDMLRVHVDERINDEALDCADALKLP